jgi:hypothetical protein
MHELIHHALILVESGQCDKFKFYLAAAIA